MNAVRSHELHLKCSAYGLKSFRQSPSARRTTSPRSFPRCLNHRCSARFSFSSGIVLFRQNVVCAPDRASAPLVRPYFVCSLPWCRMARVLCHMQRLLALAAPASFVASCSWVPAPPGADCVALRNARCDVRINCSLHRSQSRCVDR